jgi:hypothetical protein
LKRAAMPSIIRLLCLGIFFCFSFAAKSQPDTAIHAVDSILNDEIDCMRFFSSHDKIPAPSKTSLVTRENKTILLSSILNHNETFLAPDHALADLDGDGKNELVTWNFTGGAHCCDEIVVYKNISPNKYRYAGRVFAGNSCINDSNGISYNFYESFGYFFTCYACSYADTSDIAPEPVQTIILRYKKGKLIVQPGDKDLRSIITDNLGKLSEQTYTAMSRDYDQDNGLRKEFALNLAVYYYSFGKNLVETKRLFDKYYKFPDAKNVWKEFLTILNSLKKENSF